MKITYRNIKKLATEKAIAMGLPKEFVKKHIDDYDIKFCMDDGCFDGDEDADGAAEHYLNMSYYAYTLLTLEELQDHYDFNKDCATPADYIELLMKEDGIKAIFTDWVDSGFVVVEPNYGEEDDGMFRKGWWYGLERI